MIGIRVDANSEIGMGHLMRCMSIAKQLADMKQQVIFIVSEKDSKQFILQNNFECLCLNNSYIEKEKELIQLVSVLKARKIDRILLDSYEVTYEYMIGLKRYFKVVYLDDQNSFKYPADIIINYTFNTNYLEYEDKEYENEKFLLGSSYVPLRSEFSQKPIKIKEVENILITTGGADQYDIIIKLLKQEDNFFRKNIKKHIVMGKFYKNKDKLEVIAAKDSSIILYYDIDNICEVMRYCDIAISAGGTTLAELCACGIPTICFAVADNQLYGTRAYASEGIMLYAGDVREEQDLVVKNIIQNIVTISKDFNLRKTMSKKARAAIDGKGAYRIADEIIRMKTN